MKIEEIKTIYEEITNSNSSGHGNYGRLVRSKNNDKTYFGINLDDNHYFFKTTIDKDDSNIKFIIKNEYKFENLKIRVTKLNDIYYLEVYLIKQEYKEIFSHLVYDLFSIVENKIKYNLGELLDELERWRNFFKSFNKKFPINKIQGLICELLFLKELIDMGMGITSVLESWKGPINSSVDFEFSNTNIEVKFNSKDNNIHISSEFQLDNIENKKLFIIPYQEIAGYEKISINSMINSIVKTFNDKKDYIEEFNSKLREYGFFTGIHTINEGEIQFELARMQFFAVKDDFPRIIRSKLNNSLQDIRYKINLNGLGSFITDDETVLSQLF